MAVLDVEIEWDHVRSTNITSFSNNTLIVNGPARLCGWSVFETTGAAVAFAQFSSGQTVIGQTAMPAGQSNSHTIGNGGVYCPQGISMTAAGGSFTGCIYYQAPRA